MKILHVTDGIPPETLGGTGRIVTDLAYSQAKSGSEVAIVTAGDQRPDTPVKIFYIPKLPERWAHDRCVFSRSREREVLAAIDGFKPDLIHAHTVSRQCGYRWMARLKERSVKLVVSCHDVSHVAYGKVLGHERSLIWREILRYRWTWNPLRHILIRHFLSYADQLLAVSDALKDYLERRGITDVRTVPNGIDTAYWQPQLTLTEARSRLNLPQDQFLFLFAGRLGYDKGSTLIATALPKDAGLILAGDGFGAYFEPQQHRTYAFPNQSAGQMRLLYAACDAVLVPSRCLDCLPTVCLEAMAMGRPVLATSWGGAKEMVVDGTTGWIIDPLAEDAWRERMVWCLTHRRELERFGAAGRQRVSGLFGLERFRENVDAVYRRTLHPPLHVALVAQNLEGRDGWSRYARDLSRALSAAGNRVSAIVAEPIEDAPWCEQYPVLRPPLHSLSWYGCLAQLLPYHRTLSRLKPDVVHVIAEPYALLMGILSKKQPWCLTIHGSYAAIPFQSGLFARLATRNAWRRARTIISVSSFTKRFVEETEPEFFMTAKLEEKIRVIPNAITIPKPWPARPLKQAGQRHILGVGAVKARKGYLQALRALAAFRKISAVAFTYEIIGARSDRFYAEALQHELNHLGLTDIVTIRGTVSEAELETAYHRADVFLLLSIFEKPYVEGFVLAFLEAAANGVPSVGSATGGCPEAIQEGVSGYICDPNNPDMVAERLRRILEDGAIAPADCRKWAEAHDIRNSASELEEIYRQIMNFTPPRCSGRSAETAEGR